MMGLIVAELYDALVEAGASPDRAKSAAGAIPLSGHMATREDLARFEARMATRDDLAQIRAEMATKDDLAQLEARFEARMATKEDLARLDKQIAVLRLAVFGFGPASLGLLLKLAFFP